MPPPLIIKEVRMIRNGVPIDLEDILTPEEIAKMEEIVTTPIEGDESNVRYSRIQ